MEDAAPKAEVDFGPGGASRNSQARRFEVLENGARKPAIWLGWRSGPWVWEWAWGMGRAEQSTM